MKHCPICKAQVELRTEDREITVQGRTVTSTQEFFWCQACRVERLTPELLDAALRRAVEVLRKQDGLLSPDEIKQIRTSLGYNQLQFEAILGSGPKTVTRWERGTVAPSGAANRLLELFREYPHLAHEIAGRLGIATTVPSSKHLNIKVISVRPARAETNLPPSFNALDFGQLQEAWYDDASAEAPGTFPHQGPRWSQSSARLQHA